MTRVHHPKVFETEVLNGDMHRAASAGSVGISELKPVLFTCEPHQKIKFSSGIGCPEVGIAAFQCRDHLFQCEALPRCAEFWMRLQIRNCVQLKESMQEAAATGFSRSK